MKFNAENHDMAYAFVRSEGRSHGVPYCGINVSYIQNQITNYNNYDLYNYLYNRFPAADNNDDDDDDDVNYCHCYYHNNLKVAQ